MKGSIIGDIVGSVYEHNSIKQKDFSFCSDKSHFTDDTVLTIAIASALLNKTNFVEEIFNFAKKYPNAGYGIGFLSWMYRKNKNPYNSFGNGSAMRVSPIGFAFNSIEEVLLKAKESAEITHNHPEGIKGAQAIAVSIYLARKGYDKEEIKNEITERFNYDLNRSIDIIRNTYAFDVSCQGSVPEAILCFLESQDYEDCIRNAISLGGDSDTLACMAGGIAEAYYTIPTEFERILQDKLPNEFLEIIYSFYDCFNLKR